MEGIHYWEIIADSRTEHELKVGVTTQQYFNLNSSFSDCLDMNRGSLSFALDGEFMGVAYEDQLLTVGPIYASISLLHTAGCTLVSGLAKPEYFP